MTEKRLYVIVWRNFLTDVWQGLPVEEQQRLLTGLGFDEEPAIDFDLLTVPAKDRIGDLVGESTALSLTHTPQSVVNKLIADHSKKYSHVRKRSSDVM